MHEKLGPEKQVQITEKRKEQENVNICDSIKLFEKKNCPKNITACKLLSCRGGIKLSKKSMSMTYALGPDQVHVTVS